MTTAQVATMATSDGWDSDHSLSWEDFFGTSTDLVPSLLAMYDSLSGRRPAEPPPPPPPVSRPLSVSSIASSSSSSSGASSCGRLGAAPKCSAYLASIESLDDSEEEAPRQKQGSQGSGDSGVCSPCISYISSPCPPPGRPRYCDPHLSYMDRVVMEIVETEGFYVRDLQQVIQGYLERWRNSSDCPLTEKQLNDLFNNIEEIYKFNRGFLGELEECELDPVKVARCFVNKNEGFSIYTQYCTNYPRTVSLLTELMRQEATARLFRERQTALQHTLPLGSYLLKPVQRILKYHLLLHNIIKQYSNETEGYKDIKDALATMTGIAQHINNMKRRHEHAVRVQEIQSLLYGWEGEDLTTFGELCAEGAFRVYGAKAMRHVFLFDKMLLITKKKAEGILGYKTHIMCSNLMLIESVPGEPFSFHVIPFDNPRLQYTLQARSLEQKREWTMQLKRVILENYNAVIPSHARQLVMELGQNRTDDEIMADKGTPKRQHSAPEYLEKRKQEKERRKSETGLRYRLRRSRKSDSNLAVESPTSPRRGRRASSSSRERSQSREGLRSVSPAKIKERFGSWRRKSEPVCNSTASSNSSSSYSKPELLPKLTITKEISLGSKNVEEEQELPTPDEPETPTMEEQSAAEDSEYQEETPTAELPPIDIGDIPSSRSQDEEAAKNLEEIVSQLLMQNHEFQKILKKQQRQVSLRHRYPLPVSSANKDETTDTENEDDGVYETLAVTSTSPGMRPSTGQSYRAHRQAHLRALRSEQKQSTVGKTKTNTSQSESAINANDDSDYITLSYHKGIPTSYGNLIQSSGSQIDPFRYIPTKREVDKQKRYSNVWIKMENNSNVASHLENAGDNEGHGNYDNIQQIWESVQRQQEEIRRLVECEEVSTSSSIRRTQSFSAQGETGKGLSVHPTMSEISLDTVSIPTSPAVWLKQHGEHLATPTKKSGSLPRSFQLSQDSPEGSLKQIVLSNLPPGKGAHRARLLSRDGKPCTDRPFTIASDKPTEINFEDIERYMEQSEKCNMRHRFKGPGDTTEEDSLTDYTGTSNTSLNQINVHPDYKIYRPSVCKASFKHMLSSMSHKLSSLKGSSETLETSDIEGEREQILQQERRASHLVYTLARQYSKTLKQRIKTIMGEESETHETVQRTPSPIPTSASNVSLSTYKQGSSSLGARIAHCSDYANPRQLYVNLQPKVPLDPRPGSVISISSNLTSSSDGEKTSGFGGSIDTTITSLGRAFENNFEAKPSDPSSVAEKSIEAHVSDDGSADSYYERSFEAIESLLDSEIFRDSAVFSDHDDIIENDYSINNHEYKHNTSYSAIKKDEVLVKKPMKIPPPVPAKPDSLKVKSLHLSVTHVSSKTIVVERVKSPDVSPSYPKEEHLVKGLEGISKSIQERRRELELWKANGLSSSREDEYDTSSQHSTASTVIEVSPTSRGRDSLASTPTPDEASTPRGWVKHVIGKLQGSTAE